MPLDKSPKVTPRVDDEMLEALPLMMMPRNRLRLLNRCFALAISSAESRHLNSQQRSPISNTLQYFMKFM